MKTKTKISKMPKKATAESIKNEFVKMQAVAKLGKAILKVSKATGYSPDEIGTLSVGYAKYVAKDGKE